MVKIYFTILISKSQQIMTKKADFFSIKKRKNAEKLLTSGFGCAKMFM